MDKYQNRYRSASARASWWNYASDGIYFITICTDNREHYFGEIVNGEISLSEMGLIIQQEWNKSFEIRTELFCDVYVIMPNHIHAILRIENNHLNQYRTKRNRHNPTVLHTVPQNQYHRLWPDLNLRQQNGSTNSGKCLNHQFGKTVFTTILFGIKTNTSE